MNDLFQPGNGLKIEKIQNADYENDIVKEHILKLRTGEDAIKFFAKYGNSTPIKFLNCYEDKSPNKGPYDLLIEHNMQKLANYSQYYTVSPTGIVRVFNNTVADMRKKKEEGITTTSEDTTEYISLSDWMKESTQFNIVSNIHLFKNFSAIKLFTFWRSNVKYKKFIKLRQYLVKNVFFCKPVFVEKVMNVNKVLQDIHSQDIVSFSSTKTGQGPELFLSDQRGALNKATGVFNSIYDSIINTLDETLKKLKENKNEKLTSELEKINFGKQIKQKAIYLQKLEKKIKKLRDDLAREDFSKYRSFVRLINYMAVENLIDATNVCLTTIQYEINKHKKHTGGLFITTAQFSQSNKGSTLSVQLSVSDVDILQNFEKVIRDIIDSLKEVHKTLTSAQAENFRNDETGSHQLTGPDIEKTIVDSVIYQKVKNFLDTKIHSDYKEAMEQVTKKFSPCIEIQEKNNPGPNQFVPEVWSAEDHPLKEIQEKITQWKHYKSTKDNSIGDQGYGIFSVETKAMKTQLTDYINKCLTKFLDKLLEFYKINAEKLSKELIKHDETLRLDLPDTMTLKEYTRYIQDTEDASSRTEAIEAEKKDVEKAYALLTQNKIKIDLSEAKLKGKIEELHGKYQELIKQAGEKIESIREKMIEKLEKEKEDNKARVEATMVKLDESELTELPSEPERKQNIEEQIENATVLLDDINSNIETIKRSAAKIEGYIGKMLKKEKKESVNQRFKLLEDRFSERNKLWRNLKTFEDNKKRWMNGEFLRLDSDDIEKTFKQYEADRDSAATKMSLLTGAKGSSADPVLAEFNNRLMLMRNWIPIIVSLGNKNLNENHWKQIFDRLSDPIKYKTNKEFSLQDLIDDNVIQAKEFIEEVSARASGEARIENDLNEIRRLWEETILEVVPYNDSKDKYILSKTEDVFQLLDDHQAKIQSMMAQKYVVNIRPKVEDWENKLAMVQNTLEEWLDCQRQWMYLENIFSAEDIQKELPGETAKFMGVDKFWKDTMSRTNQKPNVIESAANKDIFEKFQDNNKVLEHVQKLLEDYLEKKRKAFPRFYFLTNDQLLEILSQTRNPHAVQPHMQKCFDNIKSIKFTEGQDSVEIYAMVSLDPEADPETVEFTEIVKAVGLVEGWLKKIEDAMVVSLRHNTKQALVTYPGNKSKRTEWFFNWPAQSVLVIDMIMWTTLLEDAINKYGQGSKESLNEAYDIIKILIAEMVGLVKTDLTAGQRETIKSLIVLEVHNRDVTEKIAELKVDHINNFEWAKQLRYYWEKEEDDCFAKQTNTSFRYGYEYLGNGSRLVITQLTDKCYMTLTGALHLHYGGAPEGPAGTGKTETTKDLAKALAIQCIVFNCSGNLDYVLMARFFSGLAQCGAWACFDEFNRIETEVLSVIAQQILIIQNGIKDAASEIEFEGNLIKLNHKFGVFITMNPGYAGRKELPDNLKALFRPVAMMIPDYALIAEIILFSEGFLSARGLSRKMVYLYKLSSEQLSKQKHYDFGMRAVKSVLVMAGSLRRKVPKEEEESKEAVELEAEVLLKAMRDSNVPKFLQQDLPLFFGIIQDLFPGKNVPLDPHEAARAAIVHELEKEDLQKPDSFMLKIIQLLETMVVRHGVMTVGATGTGKTTLTDILAKALTELSKSQEHHDAWFAEVRTFKLNPKSISEAELFGLNDVFTNTFTHGIVSKLITDAMSTGNHIRKWFWFDGPVDAGWIENMNTVLDDNKMLCLPDGKRIKLPTSFTMIFEVQDLLIASPATVSRCGMVFLEPYNLGIDAIFDTWKINFLKEEEKEFIEKSKIKQMAGKSGADKKAKKDEKDTAQSATNMVIEPTKLASGFAATIPLEKTFILMKDAFHKNLPKLRKNYKEEIPSVDLNLVKSCLSLFQVLYNHHKEVQETVKKNLIDSEKEQIYAFIFVFSFMWSVGGNVADHTKNRADFSREMREYFNPLVPGLPKTDFYNFYIEFTTRKWEDWKLKVVQYNYEESVPYFRILVDTTDTIRFKYILKTMNEASFNVLLMGNSGVGKSSIVKDYLYNLTKPIDEETPSSFLYATTTFSAQTSSTNVMNLFLDKLTARGRKLGPPSGKKMIFHIDDINMPKHDEFGAQPPCELLRQVIDQGGFYDLKKHTLKQIIDSCMVASCSPPGGGRNVVTPRLFRHFHMLWMPDLSIQSMEVIFKSILKGFYLHDPNTGKYISTADELIKASVSVYQQVKTKLLPTPSKCHYTFNLRDLSKVVQGMMQMSYVNYTDMNDMIKLWLHEECRIFHDRLVNETDRAIWFEILLDNLKKETGVEMTRQEADNFIFTEIVDKSTGYAEVLDLNELFKQAEKYCNLYNNSPGVKRKIDLVFFTDALKHLCRISRVIKQPRGNCLLIGVGGSGRQSLAKVAKAVNEYDFFSIEITKNYKEQKWREDLGVLLKSAGMDNKKIVFLFSDTQIIYESFLEDINNILNTGEVPNIWKVEDIDQICQGLRSLAAQQGREDNKDALMELFVHQVRENLHICLAFSPVGGKLIERCRQFPSIIDCCTIDWFDRWPDEALHSVAISQINKTSDDTLVPHSETLAKIAVTMHNDVIENADLFFEELKRKYYITPTSYLELLKTYIEMFRNEKNMIPFNIKKYSVGLEKLKETNASVKILQEEIIKYQPILDQKAMETEVMKIDLEKQTTVANQVEESVSKEAAAAQSKQNSNTRNKR